MSFRVKDELEIAIFINDVEYPLEAVNALQFFHASESTKYLVPTVHFSVMDSAKCMRQLNLADASRIKVHVKDSENTQVMCFRSNTIQKPPSGGEDLYIIDGFFDNPRFKDGTSSAGINATSSGALQQIASLCGMKYVGDSTNDKQIWYQRNMTYSKFVNFIANNGFVSPSSHMVTGVDLTGTLRYRDIRNNKDMKRVTVGFQSSGALTAKEVQPTSAAGFSNPLSGYRSTLVGQSAYGGFKLEDLSFRPRAKTLAMSEEARDLQQRGSFSFSHIDFGNNHPNYEQAAYQNTRYDALRSVGVDLIFSEPTGLVITDPFQLTVSKDNPSEYDGEYVVQHRVVYVQGKNYVEKIVALKEGYY